LCYVNVTETIAMKKPTFTEAQVVYLNDNPITNASSTPSAKYVS
jgi:hypothetical protein